MVELWVCAFVVLVALVGVLATIESLERQMREFEREREDPSKWIQDEDLEETKRWRTR